MNRLLILLISLIPTLSVKAQTTPWISQGATWFYSWWVPGMGGNDKIEYTHDTVLLGKTCEILKTTSYWYGNPGPGLPPILLSTHVLPNNYTYNNGDTVFYFSNNHFDVLYNFGAQQGSTWNLGVDTNGFQCSQSIVKVDSISTQQINSNSYRVLFTSDSSNSSVGIQGKIIEHIGSLNYLFPTIRNCDPQTALDAPIYTFSCFQDITMSYMLVTSAECENPYHVGITEITEESHGIQCTPNPTTDKLNIQFRDNLDCNISIYNMLGQKLLERNNNNKLSQQIDLRNFEKGIYLISFENKNGEKIYKRIIKN